MEKIVYEPKKRRVFSQQMFDKLIICTSKINFVYLSRNVCGMYGKRREFLRKLKKRQFLYSNGKIGLYAYIGAVNNFDNARATKSASNK